MPELFSVPSPAGKAITGGENVFNGSDAEFDHVQTPFRDGIARLPERFTTVRFRTG